MENEHSMFDYNDLSGQILKYKVLRSFTYPIIRQIFFSNIDEKDDKEAYTGSFGSFYEIIIKPSLESIIFNDGKIDHHTIDKIMSKEFNYDHVCALVKEGEEYVVYKFKETMDRCLKDILTEKQYRNLKVKNTFK
ncbi:hypothetical protein CPT_MarsHill_264 [Staphylococcus phage MarsHill]|nr:hypothetical protein CPT_MarsHill_264 [Staphylococcus phage MarsHill]